MRSRRLGSFLGACLVFGGLTLSVHPELWQQLSERTLAVLSELAEVSPEAAVSAVRRPARIDDAGSSFPQVRVHAARTRARPSHPGGPPSETSPGLPDRDAGLAVFLSRELRLLATLQELQRARRKLEVALWRARGRRVRIASELEAAGRRVQAQAKRVAERRNRRRRLVAALYRLVALDVHLPFLDPRRRRVPTDGRVELLALLRAARRDEAGEQEALRLLEETKEKLASAFEEAKAEEVRIEALRDELQAKIALRRQELEALRLACERRNRAKDTWDARTRRLARAVAASRRELERAEHGFEDLKGTLLRPAPGTVIPVRGPGAVRAVLVGAERGWKARAPAAGWVRYSGPLPGFGNVVVLQHSDGFVSVLGYLGRLQVSRGDRVRRGQDLGWIRGRPGDRGQVRYCYYELRRGGVALDPREWLRGAKRRHGPRPVQLAAVPRVPRGSGSAGP